MYSVFLDQMGYIRPTANPINSFNDVLDNRDIRVIVVTGSSWTANLRSSAPGTAKYEVFKTRAVVQLTKKQVGNGPIDLRQEKGP